jgi:hypothetical protein
MTASDESLVRLHRSRWSIGDIASWTSEGLVWRVFGSNGENLTRAEGRSRERRRGEMPICKRWEWG